MQSRYYNPEWHRFLSADVFFDTGDGVLGTNMYAYCQGDPVNFVDPGGMAFTPSGLELNKNFISLSLAAAHLAFNKSLEIAAYIQGQSSSKVKDMKYGLSTISFNGCELVAIYNAMAYLGKAKSLSSIIYDFEKNGGIWMEGAFGTKPSAIAPYLKSQGFVVLETTNLKALDSLIGTDGVYILSYRFPVQVHTVMAFGAKDGGIWVLNRYSNSTKPTYFSSFSALIASDPNYKFMRGMRIWNAGNPRSGSV